MLCRRYRPTLKCYLALKCQGHSPKSSFPWPVFSFLAAIFLSSKIELNNKNFIILYVCKGVKVEGIEKTK